MAFDPHKSPMVIDRQDLQIVVLDCPYNTIESDQTQALLGKIIAMKISGYRASYPYGVMPVDTSDFFATHLLVCQKQGDGTLVPIVGMKTVTQSRCKTFNQTFTVLNLFKGGQFARHRNALQHELDAMESASQEVGYNSSWTISPSIRDDRDLNLLCRDLCVFLLIRYYLDYGIPNVVCGATRRFRVEATKEFIGYQYLRDPEGILPDFSCIPFFGEKVALMVMRQVRSEALLWAKKYDFYWNNRLTLATQAAPDEILKVA